MKLFIDKDNNVIGIASSLLPEIEKNITIENTNTIVVSSEIEKRIEDPNDSLNIKTIKVDNGVVTEKNAQDLEAEDIKTKNIVDDEIKNKKPSEIEELRNQVSELKARLDDITK